MKAMNLYLCGVGGQGIALLGEVLSRACLAAGYQVRSVETHGLAQRGGIVVSHLRIGQSVFYPMTPPGEADLVIALERLEGLRGATSMLKPGGTLVYYNAVQQPQMVRSGQAPYPNDDDLASPLKEKRIKVEKVFVQGIPDVRMSNVALLGRLASLDLVEGLSADILRETLQAVLPPHALEANLSVFEQARAS